MAELAKPSGAPGGEKRERGAGAIGMPLAYIAVWAVILGVMFPFPITIGLGVAKPFPITYVALALGGVLLGPLGGGLAAVGAWFVAAAIAPANFIFGIFDMVVWIGMTVPCTLHMYKWPEKYDGKMTKIAWILPGLLLGIYYIYAMNWYININGYNGVVNTFFFAIPGAWAYTVTDGWITVVVYMLVYKWHRATISSRDFSPKSIARLAVVLFSIIFVSVGAGNWNAAYLSLPIYNFPPTFGINLALTVKLPERLIMSTVGLVIGLPVILALKKAGITKPPNTLW